MTEAVYSAILFPKAGNMAPELPTSAVYSDVSCSVAIWVNGAYIVTLMKTIPATRRSTDIGKMKGNTEKRQKKKRLYVTGTLGKHHNA